MKIAVYTIALNESEHLERWANSAADADYRIVADTGSTDDTVERLAKLGVTVHRIAIRPWRFDDGRNAAMALIPSDADVCCAMDMDMYLEPGWRSKLEEAWTAGTTSLYCSLALLTSVENPTPRKIYPRQFFHARWGHRFKRPVHEALAYDGVEVAPTRSDIVINHLRSGEPNHEKYLDLMDLGHREDPNDSQLCFWFARECMWANRHERAIELLKRYLAMPSSKWSDERSEAMRFLARMQPDQRLTWLDQARLEAPHRREIWLDLAEEFHGKADWLNLFWACTSGIEKSRRTGSYLDDPSCWSFRLFDLAAIAAWRLNAMDLAVQWGQKALELDPNNQRLKNNLDHFIRRHEEGRRSA